jgi:hypothetical protein
MAGFPSDDRNMGALPSLIVDDRPTRGQMGSAARNVSAARPFSTVEPDAVADPA